MPWDQRKCDGWYGYGCVYDYCCTRTKINNILIIFFLTILLITVVVVVEQVFWAFPRRRKRVHDRPDSNRDFDREHKIVEGKIPTLAKIIEDQEKKDLEAGLDPARPRELDPSMKIGESPSPASIRTSVKASFKSPSSKSGKKIAQPLTASGKSGKVDKPAQSARSSSSKKGSVKKGSLKK